MKSRMGGECVLTQSAIDKPSAFLHSAPLGFMYMMSWALLQYLLMFMPDWQQFSLRELNLEPLTDAWAECDTLFTHLHKCLC